MKEMLKEIFTDEEIDMIRSGILLERYTFSVRQISSCSIDKLFALDEAQLRKAEQDKEYYLKLKDLTEKLLKIFR